MHQNIFMVAGRKIGIAGYEEGKPLKTTHLYRQIHFIIRTTTNKFL